MARFESSWYSNLIIGLGAVAMAVAFLWIAFGVDENTLLTTEARKSGIFKLIVLAAGFNFFQITMAILSAWCLHAGALLLWKLFDRTPELIVTSEIFHFHPAVYPSPLSVEDLQAWSIEFVSGHPVLRLFPRHKYWSFQGKWKRNSIIIEGSKEQLSPVVSFLVADAKLRKKRRA